METFDPISITPGDSYMMNILLVLAAITAIFCVENENLLHSIASLAIFGAFLAILLYLMGAVWVSLFQISVFSAGIAVLGYIILTITEEDGK